MRKRDDGAVAVEFALLLPILMLFLFGIIQYGYGFFQLQAFSSTLGDATQVAANGVTDCNLFPGVLKNLADGNGLDQSAISDVQVHWLNDAGAASALPAALGQVQVTATYKPFKLGLPFIPFPDTVTRTQTASVQDIPVQAPLHC